MKNAKEKAQMHTKTWPVWLACLAVFSSPACAQSASNAFFDDSTIQQISLTVDPNDWATMLQNYTDNPYYHAQFSWNGIALDVGIRNHGGATRSPVKPNIDVNIAHYEKAQTFEGIDFFLLKANNEDPSNMHESITMKFLNLMGIPAPREAPAQLYVNGQLFGFFTIVEHEDTTFLTRNFAENGGYLYEWEDAAPYYFQVLGSDPSIYAPFLDLKTNQSSPDLQNFANLVNAINGSSGQDFIGAISPYVDPNYYLQYAAIENVLANSDGILSDPYGTNNFYLYQFQGSTLYTFIPWDEDDTFSNIQRPILQGISTNMLASRLLAIPQYQNVYVSTLVKAAQMFGGSGGWAEPELDREYNLIATAAENDPNKRCLVTAPPGPCPPGAFQTEVNNMHNFIAGRMTYVVQQATTGYQAIGSAPVAGNVSSLDSSAAPLVAGTMAILTGQNLGSSATAPSATLLPVLGQTYLTVNGERAPLASVSPQQIVFQIPNDIPPGTAAVAASVNGILSNSYSISVPDAGSVPAGDMMLSIDAPGPESGPFLGTAQFSGWAADLLSPITGITVSVDGSVQGNAQYGIVRNNVCSLYAAPGCPEIGWSFSLDTTTLSNGTHAFTVLGTSATGQHAALSASFTVANWTSATADPMRINIDRPNSQSSAFSGTAAFGGWAIDDIAAIAQVTISVDGVSLGAASYGSNRTDVCNAYPNRAGCPNVGWNALIDTTLLADGAHTLAVTATSDGGASATVVAPFTVANQTASNPVKISIDRPSSQSPAFSGLAPFGGWALDISAAIAQVAIFVDGVFIANASYNGARPDVCAAFGLNPCPNLGWNILVDTTALSDGNHSLDVTAYCTDGQHATRSATFAVNNLVGANSTLVFIDQPNAQSSALIGTASLRGWAIGNGGAIVAVDLYVDGAFQGVAKYGTARPDVCVVYPGRAGCPDVGWTYLLDTTRLSDGAHTLTAFANSTDGSHWTMAIPITIANWTTADPMTITIDSPNAQSGPLSGTAAVVGGWAIDDIATITQVAVSVDGVFVSNAGYGGSRPDVCNVYPNRAGCPNVGWTALLDTTLLGDGSHTLEVTATSSGGQYTTASAAFTVANLTAANAIRISIDRPDPQITPFNGLSFFGGWTFDSDAPISGVFVSIDGVLQGPAAYGGDRPDVCAVFGLNPCPNVGWNYALDTTLLGNGIHTLSITAAAADGREGTQSASFTVEN